MLTDATHPSPPHARGLTTLLAALTALTALSIDMSLPAMPQLQQAFGAGVSSVQLTLSAFLLGFALGQVVCGPASDSRGRRPVLLVGRGLFALAGLACALAGYLVGLFYDHTPRSLALTVAAFALLTLLASFGRRRAPGG